MSGDMADKIENYIYEVCKKSIFNACVTPVHFSCSRTNIEFIIFMKSFCSIERKNQQILPYNRKYSVNPNIPAHHCFRNLF